jgi:dihydrofolate reductase
MGRLIVDQWMTLDGVVQSPGNAQEDTEGGFRHGGWHWLNVDAITDEWVTATTREAAAFLFGRATYERFAAFWPDAGPEFVTLAEPLNDRPKYVASTSLAEPLSWHNAHLLSGDAPAAVAALKAQIEGDIHLVGSAGLARALITNGLVDEFRLFIEPILVGGGKRFLPEDGLLRRLRLSGSRITTTGVIIATYQTHTNTKEEE